MPYLNYYIYLCNQNLYRLYLVTIFFMMLSIIIPVYNVAPYIEDCLKSVMRQTYDGAMECLIVDDCGTDDSIPIAERMIAEYSGPIHFEILHHEHNRGLSAARNTGTLQAKGEYIYYLDSDDELMHDGITLMMDATLKYPDVELVQGYVTSVPYKSYYETEFLSDVEYIEENHWVRKGFYRLKDRLPVNAWNKLIKKTFIEDNALFFQEGLLFEDELWMFHVVKHLSKYCVVHQHTYIHRWGRKGSIMTTKTEAIWGKNWCIILNEVVHHLDTPFYREQLLCYLTKLVSIYGNKGFTMPSNLINDYQQELLKTRLYGIWIWFVFMKIKFPFLHKRLFKRILYWIIWKKLK